MKKTIIIYRSKTGFSQRYAQWMAEELGCRAVPFQDRGAVRLGEYDTIILAGGLYAGQMAGLKWLAKRLPDLAGKRIAALAVGCAPMDTPDLGESMDKLFGPLPQVRGFYCQGGLDYEHMGAVNRTLMAGLRSMLRKDPEKAERAYAEALRILVALRSTIKKSRVFLQGKLEAGSFTPEDSALFEALGGVWKLEDLRAIDSFRENAKIVQLSFDVSFDEAKKEYVERGWWIDLDSGDIFQTLNLRPMKALKYVKGEDSRFGVLEVPELYIYPGEGDRRVRWESAVPRPLTAEEQARLPRLAQPDLAAAGKLVKGVIKNTLAPKFLAVLVPVGALGKVGEAFVLEAPAGARIVLRDRPEDGADHASTARLAMLPGAVPAGSALFGLMFYDEGDRSLCLHPYSVVTPDQIIRLQF